MSDLMKRLRSYNSPDRTIDEQRQIAQDIMEAADEIERLRAEVQYWRESRRAAISAGESMYKEAKELRDELRIAREEIEALRPDAERYRWLRVNCYKPRTENTEHHSPVLLSVLVGGVWSSNMDPCVLDGCIDNIAIRGLTGKDK